MVMAPCMDCRGEDDDPTCRRTGPPPREYVTGTAISALLTSATTATAKLLVAWFKVAAQAFLTEPAVLLCTASGQVLDWPKDGAPGLVQLQQYMLNGGVN